MHHLFAGRPQGRWLQTLVLLGGLTYPAGALAQDGGAPADAARAEAPPGDGGTDQSRSEGAVALERPEPLDIHQPNVAPEEKDVAGTVHLQLLVGADGAVVSVDLLQGVSPALDRAAMEALRESRFRPARRSGIAVRSRIRYDVSFPVAPAPPRLIPPSPANLPVGLPKPEPIAAPPSSDGGAPPSITNTAPAPKATDVTVRGASSAQRLRESAEAVTVVETTQARRESADLGEVMARTPGISVRRAGGLGSAARLSLNGFYGEQVRVFLDAVPLSLMGFGSPLGAASALADVPVNLVDRIEVFRGVVPVRFGADALGGAINLVSVEAPPGVHANASVEMGSFGLYRLSASGRATHADTGLFAAANAFLDHADNDYPVDVQVADAQGREVPARVHLFHNAYNARGAGLELGVRERSWARRLSLRAFATAQDKQLQNNIYMSVPYGEVAYRRASYGGVLRYEQPAIAESRFGVNAVAAVSRWSNDLLDLSQNRYDWFGRIVARDRAIGELGAPADQRIWQDDSFGRIALFGRFGPRHSLTLVLSPTYANRSGQDRRLTTGPDPLSAKRQYVTMVNGLEYKADVIERRLEAIAFAKMYLFSAHIREPAPNGLSIDRNQDDLSFGYGASMRLMLLDRLWAKASFERATRLPTPFEIFGDGVLVLPTLGLMPERSINGNLGLVLDGYRSPVGELRAEVNAFLRGADRMIVLLGNDMFSSYQNVYAARNQGVEAVAGWTSPRSYVAVDANATWQNQRNKSTDGAFKSFYGDRIPNVPWFFANVSARVQKDGVSNATDLLSLGYYLRYVQGFFLGWESLGDPRFRAAVGDQLTHALSLTYLVRGRVTQTWSAEVQNLTDAKTLDYFGVQRPGRSVFVKLTGEY